MDIIIRCVTTEGILQPPLVHRGHVGKKDLVLVSYSQVSKCDLGPEKTDCKMFDGKQSKTEFGHLVRRGKTANFYQELASSVFHCNGI